MRKKIYVAVQPMTYERKIIRCEIEPTGINPREAGPALYVIGPFRTLRAARLCVAPHGPTLQTVSYFERLARTI